MDNLLFGRKALSDLLINNNQAIQEVIISENAKLDKELSDLLTNIKIIKVTNKDLDKLSDGINHQGIITKVLPVKNFSLKDIISISKNRRGVLLALDQIQDPHNLGAILRVADAMGVDGLIKTERHSASEKSATVAKTSCGANYFVPICSVSNLANAIQQLKKDGYWVIGSSLNEQSIGISALDANPPIVLVLGGEGSGMRKHTEELCDYIVHIPMKGKLQSLNVSTAASILLYEINRLVIKN